MADLRDFTKKNPIFVGTDGVRLPTGTNAQRVASANVAGTMRFNTDIDGIETYTTAGWRPLAAPPSISTVSPSTFSGESGTEFTINGEGFTPDAQVYFVTSNGTSILASTVSYYSAVQVRATTPRAIRVQEEPISVRVVQQSGTTTKTDCIDAGGVPNWITTAGTLGSIFGANTVNVYVSATDPEGTAISYQITSGSLPGGLNFTTANGLIQGVASSVLANTTYNFTIKANDTVSNNTDRSFSYTVLNRAPVINTAAGSLGTIYSGNAASASISAYDPDGGQLTYSVSSGTLPVNSSLGSANGVITGTPLVVTTNTTYSFTITSTDEGSLTASNNYTYTVLNRPPLWNTDATLSTINGADPYTPITVNAYDPDGGSVTYSLTSGSVPSGLSFVTANATLTGLPDEVQSNTTSTFTVIATDVGEMGTAKTFSLTVTPIIDTQFSNTVLLLKTAGNTVIADASSNNLPIAVTGDARASNFNPFGNSWSNYFDGTDDNLYVSSKSSVDWMISSGNSGTIEAWIYVTQYRSAASNYHHPSILGMGETYLNFGVRDGGTLRFYWYQGSESYVDSSTTVPLNTWTHVAAVVNGTGSNNLKLYINGVNSGTGTFSNISWGVGSGGNDLRIGSEGGATSSKWLGYISNLRVSNNAVYTANFSPSTTPLTTTASTTLLTCHKNRFVDETGTYTFTRNGDTKVSTWSPFPFSEADTTNGSMYFDGTGDYLTMSNSVCNVGTLPFTIEGWFHTPGSGTGFLSLYGVSNGGGGSLKIAAYDSSDGAITFDITGSSKVKTSTSVRNLMNGGWTHIALVRESTATNGTKCYINGVQNGIGTVNDNFTGWSGLWYIGHNAELYSNAFNGYISNFRMVLGTAVYPSAFTPPTAPLTAIANTSLLTLQNRQPHNNHGFQDSSNNRHLVTRTGNATQGIFTPFSAEPGKWSGYFDGTQGQSKILRYTGNAVFAFPGTFTIECWYKTTSTASKSFYGTTNESAWTSDGFGFSHNNGTFTMHINGESAVKSWTASATTYDGNWHHVAFVRDSSNNIRCFYEGTELGTPYNYTSQLGNASFKVVIGAGEPGGNGSAFSNFIGDISNFRITKGAALYSTTFTPSTTPLTTSVSGGTVSLLTCQSNRFLDNSVNSFTPLTGSPFVQPFSPFAPNSAYTTANTGGSLRLDGSGDYIDITDSANFTDLGGRAAHLEFWFYPVATGTQVIVSKGGGSADWGSSGFEYQVQYVSGTFNFYWNAAGTPTVISLAKPIYSWYHLVVSTDASNNIAFFINGVRVGTGSNAIYKPSSRTMFRVGQDVSSNWTNGIISGLRFVLGNNAYSPTVSTITVPTTPPRNEANTVLLYNFTDAAIIDYTGKNVIETVGDSKANNSISKFGGSSASFDGTGDYLQLFSPSWLALGTGDFTIECWVYFPTLTNASNYMPIIDMRPTSTNGAYPLLYCNTSGTYYYVNTSDVITGSVLSLNTWTHLAICRFNSQTKMFINGTQSGSTYSDTNSYLVGTNRPLISGSGYDSTVFLTGRINDLRITRSARYTTNFTAPTRSFPNR